MSTYRSQTTVSGIEEAVLLKVILYHQPFGLELAPQGLGQVQLRRVRWQIKQVKASFLPVVTSFLYLFTGMNSSTIQHQTSGFGNLKGEPLQVLDDESRINGVSSGGPVALIGAADEAKAVQARSFACGDEDVFAGKLPPVRHIPFLTHMAFITVEKVNEPALGKLFKFGQAFKFVSVPLRAGLFSRSSSYAFVSSAKLFKNRRSVSLDTFVPPSASNSALAVTNRWRLAFTAVSTGWACLTGSSLAFRPRPGLVNSPSSPSSSYRDNQLLTLISHMPTIEATSTEVRPCSLSNTNWQRLRKACVLPVRSPWSSASRCSAVKPSVLMRPIDAKLKHQFSLN